MAIVLRAIRIIAGIRLILSSIITTSAASIAASLPSDPIAIPTSARAKTGASLMPSPIKAKVCFSSVDLSNASTFSTLSPGNNSLHTSSTPNCFPTASPTDFLSPVNITTSFTPAAFISSIAALASGLISSEMRMVPKNLASLAT